VLAPHRREDPELDEIGLTAEDPEDALILLLREVVISDQFSGDHV
jgi:hypothetical protein